MDQAEWDRLIASIRSVDDDFDRACEALTALRETSDPSRIPELEQLIQNDEYFIREAAASPLINLRGIEALPLLLQALARGAKEGHENGLLALEIIGLVESDAEEAAPRLLELLRSKRPGIRSQAAWLLGYVSEATSPQPLLEALRDSDPAVRSSAVGSLASFKGHPDVLEHMLLLLKDADEQVRVDAASALGHFGDRRAVPDLRRATSDSSERVRYFADDSLGLLGAREESSVGPSGPIGQ
jgi:HEAT repeat protein